MYWHTLEDKQTYNKLLKNYIKQMQHSQINSANIQQQKINNMYDMYNNVYMNNKANAYNQYSNVYNLHTTL